MFLILDLKVKVRHAQSGIQRPGRIAWNGVLLFDKAVTTTHTAIDALLDDRSDLIDICWIASDGYRFCIHMEGIVLDAVLTPTSFGVPSLPIFIPINLSTVIG